MVKNEGRVVIRKSSDSDEEFVLRFGKHFFALPKRSLITGSRLLECVLRMGFHKRVHCVQLKEFICILICSLVT